MTRAEVIRMAREAGAKEQGADLWGGPGIGAVTTYWLERFAALVAAAEREACARMAEAVHQHGYDFTGNLELHEAIRARGQEASDAS